MKVIWNSPLCAWLTGKLILSFASSLLLLLSCITPGSRQQEMNVTCNAFYENGKSTCTCAIDRKAATNKEKCSFPVGLVKLTFCRVYPQRMCAECEFNDYSIGLLGKVDEDLMGCRLAEYDEKRNVHVLELTILGNSSVHNQSQFTCSPNCDKGEFTTAVKGIPVEFSDSCYPGTYGQLCNKTCVTGCVDNICYRDTGNCVHKENGLSKTTKTLIATGVGIPSLFAVCGLICNWLCKVNDVYSNVSTVMAFFELCRKKKDEGEDSDENKEEQQSDKDDKSSVDSLDTQTASLAFLLSPLRATSGGGGPLDNASLTSKSSSRSANSQASTLSNASVTSKTSKASRSNKSQKSILDNASLTSSKGSVSNKSQKSMLDNASVTSKT